MSLLSPGGRNGRLQFFVIHLLLAVLAAAGALVVMEFGSQTTANQELTEDQITALLLLVVPLGWLHLVNYIRRMHDRGHSGFWLVLFILPIVDLIMLLYLLIAPGQLGPNRYGNAAA